MVRMPELKPEEFPSGLNERCMQVKSFIAKEGGHPAWGVNHSLRIYKQALTLAEKEKIRIKKPEKNRTKS